ncbi:cyclin-K-like [Symsagittifera roscoffensis]|uniref:cyclin-K-like n=1 Tax=Symsagittifera roscoffensis TaxID=84072 RepID=UPI00307C932B
MPSWYYEKGDLAKTPSIKNGLNLLQERTFRKEGASYIMELGNYLQLHYVTCATACTYFHRFYMFHSFSEYPRYLTATACLFLAGKVEETPKKWKVVWKAATEILKQDQMVGFEGFDHKLLTYERILLQAIQFDLIVEHPHQYITKYAKTLKGSKEKVEKLVQIAWNFANDSLRTTLCLEWEPPIIAIAFLQLAGKFNNVDLNAMQGVSDRRNWWFNIFDDLSVDLLDDICHQVLDLYNDSKSGSKLKQDVKKKRHSSKISTPTSQTGVKSAPQNGREKSAEDPLRKKSRHSKTSAAKSSASTPQGKQTVSNHGITPKVESQTPVQVTPQTVAAQPTVYFAATPASSSNSQTVIVYCQPGSSGYQLPTGTNSVFTMPKMPTGNEVAKTEPGTSISYNNQQVMNGFQPNVFYPMSSNLQMPQPPQAPSSVANNQISTNSPGYAHGSNGINPSAVQQPSFPHQQIPFTQVPQSTMSSQSSMMMPQMNHFNLKPNRYPPNHTQAQHHQMGSNSPYTVPVPTQNNHLNGSISSAPPSSSITGSPNQPPFSRSSSQLYQNTATPTGSSEKLSVNPYQPSVHPSSHSNESGGRYMNNNNYHHSSNHSRDSSGSHHSGSHGHPRNGSKHSADSHSYHHQSWSSSRSHATSTHSADRWHK